MSKELAARFQEEGIDLSAPDEIINSTRPTSNRDYDDWQDELRAMMDVPIHVVTLTD